MGLTTNNKIFLTALLVGVILVVLPELAFAKDGGSTGSRGGGIGSLFKGGIGGSAFGGWGISLGPEAGGIAQALCEIVSWFQGGLGKSIASLAIIFLGIGAFFGKVTWGTALTVAVGVFAIFGSEEIVEAIVGSAAKSCCGGISASGHIAGGAIGGSACFKI